MMSYVAKQILRYFVAMVNAGVIYLLLSSSLCTLIAAESIFEEAFDVKPGGKVTTVERKIGHVVCSFTYAVQGGTDEQWQFSLKSTNDKDFTCAVYRPGGESYLFFLQFKLTLTGAHLEDVELYGPSGATLQAEEYVVDKKKHEVTHAEGKFKSQLSRIVLIGKQHKKRKHHQKQKKEL